ncbi:ABC transporter ATP-binding protein [Blastococcus haudaquaticus]|uniref:Amino acid/amide ABC transporter ATP-binding protein 2, HAAT family n=1 Tax=Blastococcus haudaquaticus TaxID=1938745 RepID=A0A286GR19_9ACTN|nr:ABC transporter ATP-binding protein [Blastococcus haudaquaticus]SOD98011.1 amino acid/amide ABC transporter ATP-binding protein 2, HAAT family [Blastococcus haudaquaticus]
MSGLLEVTGLTAGYGGVRVLHGIDIAVGENEIVAVLGANGAGKTTLLRALSGTVRSSGEVAFAGRSLAGTSAARIARGGLGHVPQGRGTFTDLTVEENVRLGVISRPASTRGQADGDVERIYETFPVLREMRRRPAGALSGGQQQMLALSRALLARPRLLLIDEPSLGLAPLTSADMFSVLARLRDEWSLSVLLAEQNARASLKVADRGVVLARGRVVASAPAAELAADEGLRAAYLGESPDGLTEVSS